MIWILTISACLISLGLNAWLIRTVDNRNSEIAILREKYRLSCREINELLPKRDAHGRFTR